MKTFPIATPTTPRDYFSQHILLKQLELLKKEGFTHIDEFDQPGHFDQYTIEEYLDNQDIQLKQLEGQ